jgi:glycosyltransferase involved in cell wall biosynthesis
MNNSLVSICMPTYNGVKFIRQALDSAILQTYRPLEIIVSDDNSNDRTLDIINHYKSYSDIPILIYKHKPSGIGENWNNCVKKSNGKYIKFLFQDDILKPDCITLMVKAIEEDKNIGLVFSKRSILIEGNEYLYKDWIDEYSNLQSGWSKIERIQDGKTLLKDVKFLNSPRNKVGEPSAVLLRKKVFNEVGFFNTELRQALDYEFWYRIFKQFKVSYIDCELAIFRIHDQQLTAKNRLNKIDDLQSYYILVCKELFWHLNLKVKIKIIFKLLILLFKHIIKPRLLNA